MTLTFECKNVLFQQCTCLSFYENLYTITINVKHEYNLQSLLQRGTRGDCCSDCLKELKLVVMAQRWLKSRSIRKDERR